MAHTLAASGLWRLRRAPVVVLSQDPPNGRKQLLAYVRLNVPLAERAAQQWVDVAVDGVSAGQATSGLGWTQEAPGSCYAPEPAANYDREKARIAALHVGERVRFVITFHDGVSGKVQGRSVARVPLRASLARGDDGLVDERWFRALGCGSP